MSNWSGSGNTKDMARRILVRCGKYVDDKNDGHVMENAVKYACNWFGIKHDKPSSTEDQEKLESVYTLAKNVVVSGGIACVAAQVGVPGAMLIPVSYWLGKRFYQNYQQQSIAASNEEVDSDEDEEFFSCNSSFADETEVRDDLQEVRQNHPCPIPQQQSLFHKVKEFVGMCGNAAVNTVKDGLRWVKRTFWNAPLNWFVKNVVDPVVDFGINYCIERGMATIMERMPQAFRAALAAA